MRIDTVFIIYVHRNSYACSYATLYYCYWFNDKILKYNEYKNLDSNYKLLNRGKNAKCFLNSRIKEFTGLCCLQNIKI